MDVQVSYSAISTLTITPEGTGVQAPSKTTVHLNTVNLVMTANGTPGGNLTGTAAYRFSATELTPGNGTATLDLRAAPGPDGLIVDGNNTQVVLLRVIAAATNAAPILVTKGASNGYRLHAAETTATAMTLPPGGEITLYGRGGGDWIDATHKTLDFVGTNTGDKAQVLVVFGEELTGV